MASKTPPKSTKKTPRTKPQQQKKKPEAPVLPQEQPLTVVGIGASAGGLKALQAFFEALPDKPGLAFVVITHLHPEYESHLPEILQNYTEMKVEQITRKVPVEADHVYVIPPDRRLLIADHKLDVRKFDEPRGLRTPVDLFFRSLADAHASTVGIILSGSGTDGAVGIKSIKEKGGLLMCQQPEEAEYDGMPRAAIATGIVDAVMPVKELAETLVKYAQRPAPLPRDPEDLTPQQQEALQRILAHVHARTGHDFSQYKRTTVLRRVQRRMQLSGFDTLEAYLDYMRHNVNEANAMFNDILIGVTNFFRDAASWDALKRKVIPALFENKQEGDAIRVWTIGCSTGEEAYTLGILLLEHAATLDKRYQIQIFASDLDDHALMQAREGIYPAAIEADVSATRLEQFFNQQNNHYQVRRELRDIVLFTNHSVLRDPPFSKLDLISCRNLLIYLQREMHENILDIFHYALNPGGYLFLGGSESADSVKDLFQTMDKGHRIYKAKPWAGDNPHVPALPLKALAARKYDTYVPAHPIQRRFVTGMPPLEDQHMKSLETFGPPSVWVDDDYVILNVSETAGRFLYQPSGPVTNDLLKLVRPELQIELRSALFQAFDKGKAVLSQPVFVQFNGHPHRVLIAVRPDKRNADTNAEHGKKALVVFLEDESETSHDTPQSSDRRSQSHNDALVKQLEEEVQHLRERLQATVEEFNSSSEEMKASNEELQSINEEYRSTTEELETSKEELQSVNEELQTVNNELRSKFEEVSRAHSDLENLMNATQIATIFLDRDLKIKRYSPGMEQIFNIRATDRGRPISDLTHKLNYDNLVEDARLVLQKLVTIEHEATDQDGETLLIRLRPYRTVDDRIDGVVISFVDISDVKNAELTRKNYKSFYTLFHTSPIPTLLTRLKDNSILNVNQAFLDYMNLTQQDVVGQSVQSFVTLSKESLKLLREGNIRNNEMDIALPSGEKKTILISSQRIQIENGDALLLTLTDITERVDIERQNRTLNSERISAELNERRRIAQLLHDDLQQRIFAIKMHLERLEEGFKNHDAEAAKEDFAKLETWLVEAIAMTRRLSSDINPVSIVGSTLSEVILWLINDMKEQHQLETRFEENGIRPKLNSGVLEVLLKSMRELLFNVVKHSGTKEATIRLERKNKTAIQIVVRDHGKGFTGKSKNGAEHISGIANIRHQLGLFDCTLEFDSAPGNGTRAIIGVPLRKTESSS
ncbi:MAG: CheR family methyltransferase [Anaerolineales bacterium]